MSFMKASRSRKGKYCCVYGLPLYAWLIDRLPAAAPLPPGGLQWKQWTEWGEKKNIDHIISLHIQNMKQKKGR